MESWHKAVGRGDQREKGERQSEGQRGDLLSESVESKDPGEITSFNSCEPASLSSGACGVYE